MDLVTRNKLIDEYIAFGLKSTTARSYSLNVCRLFALEQGKSRGDHVPVDTTWITKSMVDKIMKDNDQTVSHRRNIISALLSYLKLRNEKDSGMYRYLAVNRDELHDRYIKRMKEHTFTSDERRKIISPEQLGEIYQEMENDLSTTYQLLKSRPRSKNAYMKKLSPNSKREVTDLVIGCFYLFGFKYPEFNFGPLRNDLVTFHLADGNIFKGAVLNHPEKLPDSDVNLFVPGNPSSRGGGKLILYDSKIQKADAPPIVITLPQRLNLILRNWVIANGIEINQPLFFGVTKNSLTSRLQRVILRFSGVDGVSSSLLRKIYVTWRFADIQKERKETAANMMHSVETQGEIYTKDTDEWE